MTTGTNDALERLAALAGIEECWWDFFGERRIVPPETKRAFLSAMGLNAATESDLADSILRVETQSWGRWLDPILVVTQTDSLHSMEITITLPAAWDGAEFTWEFEEELGIRHDGTFRPQDLQWLDKRYLGEHLHHRRRLVLPGVPGTGYHKFRLIDPQGAQQEMTVILAPDRAWHPADLDEGKGLWGIATQLYALRREGDWGMGDYTALDELCRRAGRAGAASVGVNPLHALFPARPERYSPYAPSSRIFANIWYLDGTAIANFATCAEAQGMVAGRGFAQALEDSRKAELIQYDEVGPRKRALLDVLYQDFRDHHDTDEHGQAFRAFMAGQGEAGRRFATFEALQEHFLAQDPHLGYWRHWPAEFRDPASQAVADFAASHAQRVEFFLWLQWQVDVQLGQVAATCRAEKMPIGLYRDLGVGIADDGAEAWAEQDLLALGVSVGAPPDPLNLKGQDWGLAPYDPIALRQAAYRPFIDMVRANMRHAGAMRLDHAMSLQRLYWIPRGMAADQGGYLRYPMDDLFAIIRLESCRNRCLVIGEDLGTVPDGFRDRLFGDGLYAYRLLFFERDGQGELQAPEHFTTQAATMVGTHDLPSLHGYWLGLDLDWREKLGLYPRPEMAAEERANRVRDVAAMVRAFQAQHLLADDFPVSGTLSEAQNDAFSKAAHAYVERSASRLVMVQIEDVLGLVMQMNLPGTTDQHPNWRVRLPVEVETLFADPRMVHLAQTIMAERKCRETAPNS